MDIMQRVLDSLDIGIVILDPDDRIVVFNRKAGEMLQQDPESRIGSSIFRCHPERAESGVFKMITQLKNGELEKYEGWVNFIGRFMWERIYSIKHEEGNYLATIAEFHDAAERVEYLKSRGEWIEPEMHGTGASSPRTPFPEPSKFPE